MLVTRLKPILVSLTAVAAVVTPLGLYQTIVEEDEWTENVPFHYIEDPSGFGLETVRLVDLPWSRICGSLWPVECPNSFSNITTFSNKTGDYHEVHNYDSHVPQYVIDVYQSGLRNMQDSVSSIFDIQSRTHRWRTVRNRSSVTAPDNGQPCPVDSFRMISSNIMANEYLAVEGLVVDMKNGGIGFRNHSAPPTTPYGSTWSEDLLFIEPETVCVDRNLTLDSSIPKYTSEERASGTIAHLALTDRGGFANLNLSYLNNSIAKSQRQPNLWDRAYRGAWLNNVLSMAFLNVTNLRNDSDPNSKEFSYLNSHVGKRFPLMSDEPGSAPLLSIGVDELWIRHAYGEYLDGVHLSGSSILSNSTSNITPKATV